MKQRHIVIFLLSVIMSFASGCGSDDHIDKGKFTELNRTTQDLKSVITSIKPCDVPDELLQRLASGITAAKGKAASKAERDLITAYSSLLTTYKDGLLLCRSRTHLSKFEFVPKGRIYVTQELDPLVEKYSLSTERHLYEPTGQLWKSIDGDSIKVIWENADAQSKNIENMVNYN